LVAPRWGVCNGVRVEFNGLGLVDVRTALDELRQSYARPLDAADHEIAPTDVVRAVGGSSAS
jgi:hypothetical protein